MVSNARLSSSGARGWGGDQRSEEPVVGLGVDDRDALSVGVSWQVLTRGALAQVLGHGPGVQPGRRVGKELRATPTDAAA